MLISFGSDMSGVQLNPLLEACAAPNDEIAVIGLLAELLIAELSPSLVQAEPWIQIRVDGFVTIRSLRALKERHLREMGMTMSAAA